MTQTELTKRTVAQVGEEISHELGAQMIKDFQIANPNDTKSYIVGLKIIEKILSQPDCVGIKFYNAYNERGEKTLVSVGLDKSGNPIVDYSSVTTDGTFETKRAIVADRNINNDDDTFTNWEYMNA